MINAGIDIMKTKEINSIQRPSVTRRAAAILSIVTMLAGTFAIGVTAQSMKTQPGKATAKLSAKLSEDQRILHVLNRLGFGARPGAVGVVKAMGVDRYILWPLEPQKMADSGTEA